MKIICLSSFLKKYLQGPSEICLQNIFVSIFSNRERSRMGHLFLHLVTNLSFVISIIIQSSAGTQKIKIKFLIDVFGCNIFWHIMV